MASKPNALWNAWAPNQGDSPQVTHLNAAGAALRSEATSSAMNEFLKLESTFGAYEVVSTHLKGQLETVYRELATLLGCAANEISIVSSATEAWNEIIHGLAWTFPAGSGIVTSVTEYGSNYLTLLQLKRRGFKLDIHVVPETADGDVDIDALDGILRDNNIVLITLPHVPTNSGRVYDVQAVGEVARRHGVLFLLDATQSVGQMEVNVNTIGCDMLTGTGRKWLRGPRGTGFLYCSSRCRQMFEPGQVDVHSATLVDEDSYKIDRGSRMFEKYEMSFAAKAGLGVAVAELNQVGIGRVEVRICELARYLRAQLSEIKGVRVEDRGRRLCGICSFSVLGQDGKTSTELTERLFETLLARGFSVSLSRRTSTLIDMTWRGVPCVIRVSPHVYNSEIELRRLVQVVEEDHRGGSSA